MDGLKLYNTGHKEGFGSMTMCLINSYIVALEYNLPYLYTPLINIGELGNHPFTQDEWDDQWNEYISKCLLKSTSVETIDQTINISYLSLSSYLSTYTETDKNIVLNLYWRELKSVLDSNNNLFVKYKALFNFNYFSTDCLANLKVKLPHYENIGMTFDNVKHDESQMNVAIHIRKQSKTDSDCDPVREFYTPNSSISNWIGMYIKELINMSNKIIISIHSQIGNGKIEDFDELVQIAPNRIILHLDEHPIKTLHSLITADVFIMAKSTFSLVASVYAKGQVVIKSGFVHRTSPTVLTLINPSDIKRLKIE